MCIRDRHRRDHHRLGLGGSVAADPGEQTVQGRGHDLADLMVQGGQMDEMCIRDRQRGHPPGPARPDGGRPGPRQRGPGPSLRRRREDPEARPARRRWPGPLCGRCAKAAGPRSGGPPPRTGEWPAVPWPRRTAPAGKPVRRREWSLFLYACAFPPLVKRMLKNYTIKKRKL